MPKRRENSFFGIHFDFHATEGETVARIYRPDVFAELLDKAAPDFVQCDTKGHAGFSSYPTKAGTKAYEIKEDILKTWRTLTRERDIALYGHHSGLYDETAAKNHPDWAVKDENGNISREYLSPFSPYADEILIPQLKELAIDYKLDGAWIDGECWAAFVDYSDYATKKYFDETGKKPAKRGDAHYEEYREFCRKGFTDYVQHYVDEIKKVSPDFQITSNWIFSSFMPQKPNVTVDFLSGDYDPTNSVASARFQGRCISNRNIPWDLMGWGQNAIPYSWTACNRNTKEYIQYCQEAAEIISQGGGYQFFNIAYGGGGYVQEWAIPVWEKVSRFVREREYCFKSKPVKEIAVLYPEEKTPQDTNSLYSSEYQGYSSLCSWVDAIQNIQLSCCVLNEYQLCENELNKFKVLVVPNSDFIKPASAKIISEYIKNGGRVICDIKSNKYFSDITGMNNFKTEEKQFFLNGTDSLAAIFGEVLKEAYPNCPSGEYYTENFYDDNPRAAAYITEYGKGKIINLCFDFSESYKNNVSTAIEDFLRTQFKALDFKPIANIKNNSFVDVITMQKGKDLLVNLVNYSGPHALSRVRSYGKIPPLYNIEVEISSDTPPAKVYLQPGNTECEFEYKNGKISLTVDELAVHKTIIAEGICKE